jgi:hypothetical protein
MAVHVLLRRLFLQVHRVAVCRPCGCISPQVGVRICLRLRCAGAHDMRLGSGVVMADEVRGHSIVRVDYRDMGLLRSGASSHVREMGVVGVSNVQGRLESGRKSMAVSHVITVCRGEIGSGPGPTQAGRGVRGKLHHNEYGYCQPCSQLIRSIRGVDYDDEVFGVNVCVSET